MSSIQSNNIKKLNLNIFCSRVTIIAKKLSHTLEKKAILIKYTSNTTGSALSISF